MIDYWKGLYGVNLLFRVHGSSVYKATIPGLVAVIIYFLVARYWDTNENEELDHPYAIGVLLTSISFLIVFRANQGYARYWEACGDVHHMMSKWLDATTHTGCYHMQQKHYDPIKPPSYFDHYELNFLGLTRDRERGRHHSLVPPYMTGSDDFDANGHAPCDMHVSQRGATERSINVVLHGEKRQSGGIFGTTGVRLSAGSVAAPPPQAPPPASNHVAATPAAPNASDGSAAKSSCCPSPPAPKHPSLVTNNDASSCHPYLLGQPRLDGGWGLAEEGRPTPPGGHTPALFLQELCHLSSLLVAVAFCTLRNDIEGAESPLDLYIPASKWPEADPNKLPKDVKRQIFPRGAIFKNIAYWFGLDKTRSARTRYNASRPMLVLGGVSDAEIAQLQRARGASAKTQLAWNWLSEFVIREHLAGSLGAVGPPIISRIIQFLGDGMIFYNHARKIMFIPFPFPSAQLSVFFIFTVVWAVPIMLNQIVNHQELAAVLTFFTVTCLVGLHECGRELENPFRNIPNEIPLGTLLAQYNEALVTMYLGYHPDFYWDASVYEKRTEEQPPVETSTEEDKKGVPTERGGGAPAPNKGHPSTLQDLEDTVSRQAAELRELRELIARNFPTAEESIARDVDDSASGAADKVPPEESIAREVEDSASGAADNVPPEESIARDVDDSAASGAADKVRPEESIARDVDDSAASGAADKVPLMGQGKETSSVNASPAGSPVFSEKD